MQRFQEVGCFLELGRCLHLVVNFCFTFTLHITNTIKQPKSQLRDQGLLCEIKTHLKLMHAAEQVSSTTILEEISTCTVNCAKIHYFTQERIFSLPFSASRVMSLALLSLSFFPLSEVNKMASCFRFYFALLFCIKSPSVLLLEGHSDIYDNLPSQDFPFNYIGEGTFVL